MTLKTIKLEAKKYGLTIYSTRTHYAIKLNGRLIATSPKKDGLARLSDVLANCAA